MGQCRLRQGKGLNRLLSKHPCMLPPGGDLFFANQVKQARANEQGLACQHRPVQIYLIHVNHTMSRGWGLGGRWGRYTWSVRASDKGEPPVAAVAATTTAVQAAAGSLRPISAGRERRVWG